MPVNIGAELQALPLGFMLGAPMKATIEAQALSAQTTTDFINNYLVQDDTTGTGRHAVMVEFTYKQTIPDPLDPTMTTERDVTMNVPLFAITQMPYLRVNDLTVDFEFKIQNVMSRASSFTFGSSVRMEDNQTYTGEAHAGAGVSGFMGLLSGGAGASASYQDNLKLTVNVSATYQRTERETTDRSATFKMHLNATQDPIPEGMRRVLQIMADAIQAQLPTTVTPPPAPAPHT